MNILTLVRSCWHAIWARQPDAVVTDAPPLRMVSNSRAVLTQDWRCVVTLRNLAMRVTITVKASFTTDGASIPAEAWTLIGLEPFSGVLVRGAVAHDALYASEALTRQMNDRLLYQIILDDHCRREKADAVYDCVSEFGGLVYAQHTRKGVEEARKYVTVTTERI